MVALKRSWEEARAEFKSVESFAMTNCVMISNRFGDDPTALPAGQVFKCKTCKRQFHSFQALGGHRASHKKPKILKGNDCEDDNSVKKHVCGVCGLEFDRGQALGGHMSKHRTKQPAEDHHGGGSSPTVVIKEHEEEDTTADGCKAATLEEAVVLSWDLNLTPFQNELVLARDDPPSLDLVL